MPRISSSDESLEGFVLNAILGESATLAEKPFHLLTTGGDEFVRREGLFGPAHTENRYCLPADESVPRFAFKVGLNYTGTAAT